MLTSFFVFSHSVFAIIAVCGPSEACGGGGGGNATPGNSASTTTSSTTTTADTTTSVDTTTPNTTATNSAMTPTEFVENLYNLSGVKVNTANTQSASQSYQELIDQLTKKRSDLFITDKSSVNQKNITGSLDIKITPQNPGPLEAINITVESYISDLDKAKFVWSLNGKVVSKGIGLRTFSFVNGPSGKTTRLHLSATTNNGIVVEKDFSWNPIALTILWEAQTYTPPFYRGKALITSQATVRAIAIPDNTSGQNALGSGGLAYVWQKDRATIAGASGYGKNSFAFLAPKPFGKTAVSVLASSVDNSVSSENKVALSFTRPFVLFYEKDPLLGVLYNHPINSSFDLTKTEFSISAEPYFFSNDESDESTINYNWSINGKSAQNNDRVITLRNNTGGEGDSLVSLAVNSVKKIFQDATQSVNVHLTNNESSAGRASF